MSEVQNPERLVTKQDLNNFYDGIRPYLGGKGGSLGDLSDTTITTPSDGQVLTYNATSQKWVNGAASADIDELGDITDVDLSNLQDGQTIVWDATNSKWVNGAGGGGGTSDYSDLTNKPSINNVTLTGNKTSSDLGLAPSTVADSCYKTDDTTETTLADGDYFPFHDTSASGARKSLWSNIKSVLKTYFDTLYSKAYTVKTATLTAGTNTVTFTNIPSGNYMLSVYTSIQGVDYYSSTTSGTSVTYYFPTQSSDMTVYLKIESV